MLKDIGIGMTDLSVPTMTVQRLEEIENDLAIRQNLYESAARGWFVKLGNVTKDHAVAYGGAEGTSTEKKEAANELHGADGAIEQAEYEALKAVIKVLEMRATIGMSILKSQGRA